MTKGDIYLGGGLGLGTGETHFPTINVSHPTPTLLNANTCHHQRERISEGRMRNNLPFNWIEADFSQCLRGKG